jgi:hypothetical protein
MQSEMGELVASMGEVRKAYRILVRKPEEKSCFGRLRYW